MQAGRLELILGPMCSGKSSELIRRYRRYAVMKRSILAVCPEVDTRSGSSIRTHNGESVRAVVVSKLEELLDPKGKHAAAYSSAAVVAIDECQFFGDLHACVQRMVEADGKIVLAAGLDADYRRREFGDALRLVPFADDYCKMLALCTECNDGTPAPFTQRTSGGGDVIEIGGMDSYRPVCRRHYAQGC
jgi:thymidine kinase